MAWSREGGSVSGKANTRLEALVQAAGLSPAQLARALRTLADEQGLSVSCDYTTVRRWLKGTQPRPPAPALLLECLGRRLGQPVTAQEAGLTHTQAVVVDPAWEADPLRKLAQLSGAELDPARQSLLGAEAFSLATLAMPEPIMSSSAMSQPASDRPPTGCPAPIEADRWHGMSHMFHAAAEKYGGEPGRAALAAFLAHQVVPVVHSLPREPNHRNVLSGAAQLTLLLGNMSLDSGHGGVAQHYHRTAARLAADAGDRATLAIALRTMAAHAHELGHHSPVVLHLSEQAVFHAGAAPPAVQAYAYANYAVQLAHYDRRAALDALARAERLHARADGPAGPFTAYPAGGLYYQRAETLGILGDHQGCLNALNTSLRLRSEAEIRATALTRARLAETHMRAGHLEQALTQWQAFLTACTGLGSARVVRHMRTMRQQLRPYQRHGAVRRLFSQATLLE